jgi:hypothetical protein
MFLRATKPHKSQLKRVFNVKSAISAAECEKLFRAFACTFIIVSCALLASLHRVVHAAEKDGEEECGSNSTSAPKHWQHCPSLRVLWASNRVIISFYGSFGWEKCASLAFLLF